MFRRRLQRRLQRKWEWLGKRRARQIRLGTTTKRRGHYRRAANLGHRMRNLRERIENLEQAKPNWKREWVARFVAPWEGFRSKTYLDSGGVPTIGFGHTGEHATPGNTISYAFALRLLADDIRGALRCVDDAVEVPLTARERIGAGSFAFNVGCGGLRSSTFLRLLNEGKRLKAADALLMWVKDDRGNTLLGLKRRREAERWLFYHPKKGVSRV